MDDCEVRSCARGVLYLSRNYLVDTSVRIHGSSFQTISRNALRVDVRSTIRTVPVGTHRTVDICRNTFDDVCDINLFTRPKVNLTFYDNTLTNCQCRQSPQECLVRALTIFSRLVPNRVTDVSGNVFRNNSDQCLVRLTTLPARATLHATFAHNQLLDNDVTRGVVLLESPHFTLTQNLFDNPASPFDVRATIASKKRD